MKRVAIIGNSGAGKSTLAAALSKKTGLPLIASDAFYWGPDWCAVPDQIIRQRVMEAVAGDTWVIDGNFVSERDIVWEQADTLLWLDYPLSLVLLRVIQRNLAWFLSQQAIWSGNRMSWSQAWSGIRHAHRTFGHKRNTYPAFLAKFLHLEILHFRSPREVQQWMFKL